MENKDTTPIVIDVDKAHKKDETAGLVMGNFNKARKILVSTTRMNGVALSRHITVLGQGVATQVLQMSSYRKHSLS